VCVNCPLPLPSNVLYVLLTVVGVTAVAETSRPLHLPELFPSPALNVFYFHVLWDSI
jgi:hypothetical protein